MKRTPWMHIEQWRVDGGPIGGEFGDPFGCFWIPYKNKRTLIVVVGSFCGAQNEHVSVSLRHQDRTPNDKELKFVKELFWEPYDRVSTPPHMINPRVRHLVRQSAEAAS